MNLLPNKPIDPVQRFWDRVELIPFHECWEWTGTTNWPPRLPYGRMKINGKVHYAHRFSWEYHHGAIPKDRWVLHRCDNPGCVNPDHLFLGTPEDNVKDCVSKGRYRNGRAKLSASDVVEIRRLLNNRTSWKNIRGRFNISDGAICSIKRGGWKNV